MNRVSKSTYLHFLKSLYRHNNSLSLKTFSVMYNEFNDVDMISYPNILPTTTYNIIYFYFIFKKASPDLKNIDEDLVQSICDKIFGLLTIRYNENEIETIDNDKIYGFQSSKNNVDELESINNNSIEQIDYDRISSETSIKNNRRNKETTPKNSEDIINWIGIEEIDTEIREYLSKLESQQQKNYNYFVINLILRDCIKFCTNENVDFGYFMVESFVKSISSFPTNLYFFNSYFCDVLVFLNGVKLDDYFCEDELVNMRLDYLELMLFFVNTYLKYSIDHQNGTFINNNEIKKISSIKNESEDNIMYDEINNNNIVKKGNIKNNNTVSDDIKNNNIRNNGLDYDRKNNNIRNNGLNYDRKNNNVYNNINTGIENRDIKNNGLISQRETNNVYNNMNNGIENRDIRNNGLNGYRETNNVNNTIKNDNQISNEKYKFNLNLTEMFPTGNMEYKSYISETFSTNLKYDDFVFACSIYAEMYSLLTQTQSLDTDVIFILKTTFTIMLYSRILYSSVPEEEKIDYIWDEIEKLICSRDFLVNEETMSDLHIFIIEQIYKEHTNNKVNRILNLLNHRHLECVLLKDGLLYFNKRNKSKIVDLIFSLSEITDLRMSLCRKAFNRTMNKIDNSNENNDLAMSEPKFSEKCEDRLYTILLYLSRVDFPSYFFEIHTFFRRSFSYSFSLELFADFLSVNVFSVSIHSFFEGMKSETVIKFYEIFFRKVRKNWEKNRGRNLNENFEKALKFRKSEMLYTKNENKNTEINRDSVKNNKKGFTNENYTTNEIQNNETKNKNTNGKKLDHVDNENKIYNKYGDIKNYNVNDGKINNNKFNDLKIGNGKENGTIENYVSLQGKKDNKTSTNAQKFDSNNRKNADFSNKNLEIRKDEIKNNFVHSKKNLSIKEQLSEKKNYKDINLSYFDSVSAHVIDFLSLYLSTTNQLAHAHILNMVPFLPARKEYFIYIFKTWLSILNNRWEIQFFNFFSLKTPALIGIINVLGGQESSKDILILLHTNLKKTHSSNKENDLNNANLFSEPALKKENRSDVLDLISYKNVSLYFSHPLFVVIYYSERQKVINFNYSGILEYVCDESLLENHFDVLLYVIKLVHVNGLRREGIEGNVLEYDQNNFNVCTSNECGCIRNKNSFYTGEIKTNECMNLRNKSEVSNNNKNEVGNDKNLLYNTCKNNRDNAKKNYLRTDKTEGDEKNMACNTDKNDGNNTKNNLTHTGKNVHQMGFTNKNDNKISNQSTKTYNNIDRINNQISINNNSIINNDTQNKINNFLDLEYNDVKILDRFCVKYVIDLLKIYTNVYTSSQIIINEILKEIFLSDETVSYNLQIHKMFNQVIAKMINTKSIPEIKNKATIGLINLYTDLYLAFLKENAPVFYKYLTMNICHCFMVGKYDHIGRFKDAIKNVNIEFYKVYTFNEKTCMYKYCKIKNMNRNYNDISYSIKKDFNNPLYNGKNINYNGDSKNKYINNENNVDKMNIINGNHNSNHNINENDNDNLRKHIGGNVNLLHNLSDNRYHIHKLSGDNNFNHNMGDNGNLLHNVSDNEDLIHNISGNNNLTHLDKKNINNMNIISHSYIDDENGINNKNKLDHENYINANNIFEEETILEDNIEVIDKITPSFIETDFSWILDTILLKRNDIKVIRHAINILHTRIKKIYNYSDILILFKIYNILGIRDNKHKEYLHKSLFIGPDFSMNPETYKKIANETSGFFKFYFLNLNYITSVTNKYYNFPDKNDLMTFNINEICIIHNSFKKKSTLSILKNVCDRINSIWVYKDYAVDLDCPSFMDIVCVIKNCNKKDVVDMALKKLKYMFNENNEGLPSTVSNNKEVDKKDDKKNNNPDNINNENKNDIDNSNNENKNFDLSSNDRNKNDFDNRSNVNNTFNNKNKNFDLSSTDRNKNDFDNRNNENNNKNFGTGNNDKNFNDVNNLDMKCEKYSRNDIDNNSIVLQESPNITTNKTIKNSDIIVFYMIELVQCLKREMTFTDIFIIIFEMCKDPQIIHALLWNLKANIKDCSVFSKCIKDIENLCRNNSLKTKENECAHVSNTNYFEIGNYINLENNGSKKMVGKNFESEKNEKNHKSVYEKDIRKNDIGCKNGSYDKQTRKNIQDYDRSLNDGADKKYTYELKKNNSFEYINKNFNTSKDEQQNNNNKNNNNYQCISKDNNNSKDQKQNNNYENNNNYNLYNNEDEKQNNKYEKNINCIDNIKEDENDKNRRSCEKFQYDPNSKKENKKTDSIKNESLFMSEIDFFNELTQISSLMIPFIAQEKKIKKGKINSLLSGITVPKNIYMPVCPEYQIVGIVPESGKVLQSHAKVPFMASFYCVKEKDTCQCKKEYLRKMYRKMNLKNKEKYKNYDFMNKKDNKSSSDLEKNKNNGKETGKQKVNEHGNFKSINSGKKLEKNDVNTNDNNVKTKINEKDYKNYEYENSDDNISQNKNDDQKNNIGYREKDMKNKNNIDQKYNEKNNIKSEETNNIDFDEKNLENDEHNKKEFDKNNQTIVEIQSKNVEIMHLIFKAGDDCRQDMMAIQLISIFKQIFEEAKLDIYLYPYKVIATGYETGIIQVVPNAITRDQIGREKINNLVQYFQFKYGFREGKDYIKAVENFTKSLVGYSLVSYFLNIKDRHNANIMITDKGHMVHIDFGFIFEISPGNLNLEAPLKLTKEIYELLLSGNMYKEYIEMMVKGFFVLRRKSKDLVFVVDTFEKSGLTCFKPGALDNFIGRFRHDLNDEKAREFIINMVNSNVKKIRTWVYDKYQQITNNIAF